MIIDHENKKDIDLVIEVLITDEKFNVSTWIPVLATSMYIINQDREPVKVKEIRLRNLKNEN